MKSAVILISGRGSNMQAIVEAELPLRIAAVISNRPDAKGLSYAKDRDIATAVVDHKDFASTRSVRRRARRRKLMLISRISSFSRVLCAC